MIASEVFHEIPMYKNYGHYPDNTSFGNFSVSYEKDLAEIISENKFLYTNHTSSVPPAPEKLEQIAGFGNSTIVKYEGEGTYFLDRVETVDAFVASSDTLQSVQLHVWTQGFRPEALNMNKVKGYHYQITIPGDKIKAGMIRYHIVVKQKDLRFNQ